MATMEQDNSHTNKNVTGSNNNNNNVNEEPLPKNRFELELEFLQCLASPAYLHFLATSSDLNELLPFFQYLRQTYRRPEYARYVRYPNAFYFLDLLIDRPTVFHKEFTLPEFRNFCHQQQFLAWQFRHANCYGVGKVPPGAMATTTTTDQAARGEGGGVVQDSGEKGGDGEEDTVMMGTRENDGADEEDSSS